jgi:hypothetical protein
MADLRSLLAPLRRHSDPAASTDPVISGLVTRLGSLPPPPGPDFRAELRAQLVAVTPRLVAEGEPPKAEPSSRPSRSRSRMRAAWRRVPLRRPLAVVGVLVAVFALLLTGAVWLSSRTLPGDSLYGLKRASENVQLSLTSGDGARGKEYLTLAKRRVDEVAKLLSRASGPTGAAASGPTGAAGPGPSGAAGPNPASGIDAHLTGLITATLNNADSDLRNASRLLTGQAVRTRSADPLQTLQSWTPGQVSRLTAIVNRIPTGSLHNRAAASKALGERVLERTSQLRAEISCSCLAQTSADDLGPLPCPRPCAPAPRRPTGPSRAPSSGGPSGASTAGGPSGAPTTGGPITSPGGGAPSSPPASRSGPTGS